MAKRCDTHHGSSHFRLDGQWCCSGCGKIEAWSDSWSYFGALACFKCRLEPAIEFVACSDACRARYEPDHPVVALAAAKARQAPAVAAEIDKRIAAARKRVADLLAERKRIEA